MVKTLLYLCLGGLLLGSKSLIGQNLVPNGSFEVIDTIPSNPGQVELAQPWNILNGDLETNLSNHGSPDLISPFSSTSFVKSPQLGLNNASIVAQSGDNFLGLFTYENHSQRREYLGVKLLDTLKANIEYELSFYLNSGRFDDSLRHHFVSNGMQVHFSDIPLYQNEYDLIDLVPTLSIDSIIDTQSQWQKYSFNFIATESFSHLSIGNFKKDDNTLIDTAFKSTAWEAEFYKGYSYFFLDNVLLIRITDLPLSGDTLHKTCRGDSTTLEVQGDTNISWYKREPLKYLTQNTGTLKVMPDTSTWYRAIGRTDTLDIYVEVAEKPRQVFTDTTFCINEEWLVPYQSVFYDSILFSPLIENYHLIQEGTYTFTSWLGYCSRADTIDYLLEDCEVLLTYPNIFTPNSDGVNDVFAPMEIKNIAKGVLRVYNRWGKEIYFCENLEFGWDGQNVSDGVYYYSCIFTNRFGIDGEVKGWVVVER